MSFKYFLVVAMAGFVPGVALADPSPMRGACAGDVKALCGSIQPGGGRIRDCMKDHRAELSSNCKIAIADRMLERRSSPSAAAPPAAKP
jgi:hypothetical protein